MKKILRGCGNIFLVLIVLGVVSNIFRGGDRNTTSTRPTTIPPTQTPYIIIITATTGITEARPSGLVTTIPTATPGVVALAATDEPTSTAPSSSTPAPSTTPIPSTTPVPPTATVAASATPMPPTATVIPSATITETPRPTSTTEPTVTPLPITPPPPQATVNAIAETTYYATRQANLRSCPQTSCDRVGTVQIGTNLTVTGIAQGESVSTGNPVWYRVVYGGGTAYIYSGLATNVRPAPAQPAPAQQAPAQSQPSAPVEPRASSGNTRRPANCTEAVAMGLSDVEAAQWSHLDRDKDGVACYGD